MALFRLLFQRYASALLLSMTLRQFIKATKKRFLFCIKNRPGFHCGNRGGSFALFVLFVSVQALTRSLAGILDGSPGRVIKLQSVRTYLHLVQCHHQRHRDDTQQGRYHIDSAGVVCIFAVHLRHLGQCGRGRRADGKQCNQQYCSALRH